MDQPRRFWEWVRVGGATAGALGSLGLAAFIFASIISPQNAVRDDSSPFLARLGETMGWTWGGIRGSPFKVLACMVVFGAVAGLVSLRRDVDADAATLWAVRTGIAGLLFLATVQAIVYVNLTTIVNIIK